MKKYRINWEELYSIEIEANSEQEAKEKWEGLTTKELEKYYKETTLFEVEENE